jgi:hypothetical protein
MKKLLVVMISGVSISVIFSMALSTNTKSTTSSRQFQRDELQITNLTRAFEVVSTTQTGDVVQFSFRNGYYQAVNEFTLSGGANSGVQVDLLSSDHEIAPGAVYDYRAFVSNLDPSGSSIKPPSITLLNVVFEDGTGDGDKQTIELITNRRRGEKAALDRIVPLLDRILKTSDLESPQGMRQLRERMLAEIAALEKEKPDLRRGIQHGKSRLLTDLEQVEDSRNASVNNSFRDQMVRIKQHYEKESAKLLGVSRSPSN